MKIADSVVLVTGANRGIGRALVEESWRGGAAKALERQNAALVAGSANS